MYVSCSNSPLDLFLAKLISQQKYIQIAEQDAARYKDEYKNTYGHDFVTKRPKKAKAATSA